LAARDERLPGEPQCILFRCIELVAPLDTRWTRFRRVFLTGRNTTDILMLASCQRKRAGTISSHLDEASSRLLRSHAGVLQASSWGLLAQVVTHHHPS
jgi:hypothetical protein